MWLYEASWRDRELAKARGMAAAMAAEATEESARGMVLRTKGEGKAACGSQWRAICLLVVILFFPTCIVKTDQTSSLCTFYAMLPPNIRRWKEQCDLIVPFHFISDTIPLVIFTKFARILSVSLSLSFSLISLLACMDIKIFNKSMVVCTRRNGREDTFHVENDESRALKKKIG